MDTVAENTALVEQYRKALRDWSAARALHSPDSPEVREAFRRLEDIERRIEALGGGAVVKRQPTSDAGA